MPQCAPSFQEAIISQIPALRPLQQLGRVILEKVLAGQLRRLNKISVKGRELPFSGDNIAKAIEALRDIPFEGLVRSTEKVYDLLTLVKSFDQTLDGETKPCPAG
jgi:type I restriction enzyme, R subunit